nr:merozoite surface protein 1 [Plasmodium knowlesi]
MKALLFLFSLIFFVTKCQCETEDYKQLLVKLDKLEGLVVDGYELFHKNKIGLENINAVQNIDGNNVNVLAYKIRDIVGKYLELQIPGHGNLLHMIRELALDTNGLKYLVESYEEFNQLMHVINFNYDLLRAKLNDMCAHEYCKIPEHLKISAKELDMLKKVVLGYRKPLDNIKDDIGKMEAFINKNKETISNINKLITEENAKIVGHPINGVNVTGASTDNVATTEGREGVSGGSDSPASASASPSSTGVAGPASAGSPGAGISPAPAASSTTENYDQKKVIFQAIYNFIFYTNQLEEAQKLMQVLEKRVKLLKEHKSIKAILEQIAAEKNNVTNNATTGGATTIPEEVQKKIADLEKQIVAIAKTVNFDMDGLFTNVEELEYYLREKAKMAGTLIGPESSQSTGTPGKAVPTLKETYPYGITYALPERTIYELIEKFGSEESFGDLQNPDNARQPNKGIIINETKRKTLVDKIMSKIKLEEENLPNLKKEYDEKMEQYKQKVKDFLPTLKYFYEGKLDNTLVGTKFDEFKTKRAEYMKEKEELEKCTYEQSINLINKLKKQLTYLVDYTLKKDVTEDEINYFSDLEWKLKNEIYELAKEVRKNENKLIMENKFDFSGVLELQIHKVLMIKKIGALKNVQNLLKNAKLKDKLYIPKVYKTGQKPEPYYLIVLKKEIDKLKDFIPKIETMIATEKAKAPTEPVKVRAQSLRGASETAPSAPSAPPAQPAATTETQSVSSEASATPTPTATESGSGSTTSATTAVQQPPQPAAGTTSTTAPAEGGAQEVTQSEETATPPGPEVPATPVPGETEQQQEQQQAAEEGSQNENAQQEGGSATPTETTPVETTPVETTTAVTPPATTAPAAPAMSKLEYLEKLLEFLKSSYACHKHIFLTNSTMNPELLKQYALTTDEEKKIKESACDELDLLFNVQNNLPSMYSIYDTMINDLQNLYIELYQKEMVYNIFKNKDTDTKIKAFLETLKSNAAAAAVTPAVVPAPAEPVVTPTPAPAVVTPTPAPAVVTPTGPAAAPTTTNPSTTPSGTTTNAVSPTTAVTPGAQDTTQTTTENATETEETSVSVQASSEEEPETNIVHVEKIYEKHLSQMDKYNDYFIKFLESQKEKITSMTEEQANALGAEIEALKKKVQVSLDHYGKYKLKLERFLEKKNKISNSKEHIKKLTSLKNKLERKLNFLNNPTSVLKNYIVFFNKKKEAEKKEVENTLKNTEILLKYYKARAKYYIGEPFPLKTLSEESLQKEDNYLNLEKFRVLSRMEGRLGNNINLEKENISYLSSGLHHVFTELKEIIKNKKYTGNDHAKNTTAVKEALQAYEELLPKVATQTASLPPVAPPAVVPPVAPEPEAEAGALPAAVSEAVPEAEAGTPPTQTPAAVSEAVPEAEAGTPTPAEPTADTAPIAPTESATAQTTPSPTAPADGATAQVVAGQNYGEDYDKVITLPLFGNDEDDVEDQEEKQIITGEAENAQPENIVPEGINEYEVVYIKPLAGMYKSIKKQLENHVAAFNTNITDMLDSRLKKRNYFLDVLDSELNPFKYSSSGEYIIKDPYKLLDLEQKKKLLGSYQYIGASVDKDLITAKDGMEYYNKMGELYKKHLEAVNAQIKEIEASVPGEQSQLNAQKEELKKYLPFLNSIQKEYESLVNMAHTYKENLKKFINNCQIEKKETEIIVKKLEDYTKIDENLEIYKKSKKESDVRSSGLLEKLKNSKLINEEESKKVLSQLLNVQTQMLNMSSAHKCIDTNVPENAACYRYLDGTEEWRCLLGFKEVGGKCVPASITCEENNGGCAPEAECTMDDKKEVECKCTKEGSEPLFEGVFCSSSSFLSLSFLLLILIFFLSMEL